MKLLLTLALGVLCLNIVNSAWAEERIDHYVPAQPGNAEEALVVLTDKLGAISPIVAKESLTDNDLEAIHEASYSLEAAVDKLREGENEVQEAALDQLDEAVQAIHYASENHEEAKTREWFAVLMKAEQGVRNVF